MIVKEHRYALPSRVPGKNYSYSDHESIEAVFEISADKFNFERIIKVNDGKNTSFFIKNVFKNIYVLLYFQIYSTKLNYSKL